MTFMPIQLPPGIVRGANPDDTPGRWYDGSLIRWREGVMEPVGGWSRITSTPLLSTVRAIHKWRKDNNQAMTLIGCDDHVYCEVDGTYYNITPLDMVSLNTTSVLNGYSVGDYGTSTYGTPRTGSTTLTVKREAWSFANWGEDVLCLNSSDGRMFYFDATYPSRILRQVGVYDIISIARVSGTVTVITSTAHNLTSGDTVKIDNVPLTTLNIDSATVTVTNATEFTYSQAGDDASWSVSDTMPGSGAAALVSDEIGFALDFTDNSYALSYTAQVRDLAVPIDNRTVIVTPERHVMLIGSGGYPRRVAWSSREDYTDWNFASTTNTAGFLDLQSETPLVTGVGVREGTLIWSVNRAFLMRYVGLPFIYGADELGSTQIYSVNSFAEADGRCVFQDNSGFMLYEGGSLRPLSCPLDDYIFSNIDDQYGPRRAHGAVNGKFDEVWFFYPSSGSEECDRYVIWNWSENWWSMGTLARTAATPAGVGAYPVMAGTDNNLYQHEDGWTYDGFVCANNVFIASGTINLPGDEQSMNITQLVPSNGGNYNLTKYTLYTRMTPNGSERQFGPYYSRSDGYVDTRATGRDVRIRICANDAGDWSIGRLRMKISAGGRR